MAEIKTDQRQIAQPNAPDLSEGAKAYAAFGQAVQSISGAVGDYVKANRVIEEKTLLAGASQDLERLQLKYMADPELSLDKVAQFQLESKAISDGWLQGANKAYAKTLNTDLQSVSSKLTTKLMGASYQRSVQNERRDIAISINEYQDSYVNNIAEGDYESAAKNKQDLDQLIDAYKEHGASAKELIHVSQATETMGLATRAMVALKRAPTEQARIEVMQEMTKLPDTPANTAAFNAAYKEFTRLNKLYKEGEDLSGPLQNMLTGNSWQNTSLDAKRSDALVAVTAKNIANRGMPQTETVQSVPVYQALPAFKGQAPTYDFNEEINAWREGREIRRYLVNQTAQALDAPVEKEPTFYEIAQAHALVNSMNSTEFPKQATNRLLAGAGEQAKEAVEALNFVTETAPATVDLDTRTDMIYSEFKIMKEAGRTDYDNMILEARKTVNSVNDTDIKLYKDMFEAEYSTVGSKAKSLNKAFIEATGINALNTNSQDAFNDFFHYFRTKYITSKGNTASALDAAKRQMVKIHGADRFSSTTEDLTAGSISSVLFSLPAVYDFSYVRYAPTKLLSGLTPTQINNQLTEQLVALSERNKNVKVPEHYKSIVHANDTEKMERNLSFPAPLWSKEHAAIDPANYITQNIEGAGEVEGRVFLKSNSLTAQNNTGMPVWEVWMQDRLGREHPVIDNSSSVNNIMLFKGQTAEMFAPEWAQAQDEKDINEAINRVLTEEGRVLYPVVSMTPVNSYLQRKAYTEDLKNIERVKEKVTKIIKTGKGEQSD